ncbi:hypothetical protein F444_22571 [Phytophthora nicotianae P1976]|uniref:Uncharacterized protein n=1 Tax=Phytophthora nicotianae P1976 TaxID=1317066 RepID=A0A080YXE0_PHYNI|nr:hypothetical protein F444_22571 [Phytophthora nicotianae P1976]
MTSNSELLADCVFLLEAENILNMNPPAHTDNVDQGAILAKSEERVTAPPMRRGGGISSDSAAQAWTRHLEREKLRRRRYRLRIKSEIEGLRQTSYELSATREAETEQDSKVFLFKSAFVRLERRCSLTARSATEVGGRAQEADYGDECSDGLH